MTTALIVDDSATMRKIVARSIRQSGVKLENLLEAENGADALQRMAENSIDIVLTDINMPVMGGLDLISKIKEQPRYANLPIVVISTESGKEFVIEAIKRGAQTFIKKPFTPQMVEEKLKPLIG